MIIMKFGGSSTADLEAINRVTQIVKNAVSDSPVVVFSAMGKTTKKLFDAAKHVESGNGAEALNILSELKRHHKKVLNSVTEKSPSKKALDRLEGCFTELDNLFKGLAVLKDLSPKSLDKILSFGELMASIIMEQAMCAADIRAHFIDARELIITDDNFGGAVPLYPRTSDEIRGRLLPIIEQDEVVVTQGFIGSTEGGHTTTLGFEGSDYTAAILGNALHASRIELWKTVPGMMSADPTKFTKAAPIQKLSYYEAATLTSLGASCIHAKAISPAQLLSIPMIMKNSANPSDRGTIISYDTVGDGTARSITQKDELTMIWIRKEMGMTHAGISHAILSTIQKNGIIPVYFSMVESGIVALIGTNKSHQLINDLDSMKGISWNKKDDLTLVSIVGEGLTKSRKFYLPILKALDGTFVHHIIEDTTFRSFGILIDRPESKTVIENLHRALFERNGMRLT